jgi:DNA-directed RNA polymerase II subunit RPB2
METLKSPSLIHENESNGKIYKHKLRYNNVRLKEPMDETSDDINTVLFPEDFKTRFLYYSSRLIADVEQIKEIYTPETDSLEVSVEYTDDNVTLGKIPVMVRSNRCNTVIHKNKPNNECQFNAGGYFIIKGAEKIVIPQETIIFNRCLVFPKKGKNKQDGNVYTVSVYSKVVENLNSNQQIVSVTLNKDNVLMLTMSQLVDIPVCILFKALGIVSSKAIIEHITMNEHDTEMMNKLIYSINACENETYIVKDGDNEYTAPVKTREDAIKYLIDKIAAKGKRFSDTDYETRMKQAREYLHNVILERDFLPHITGGDYKKGCFLGLMCHRLMNYYLGRVEPDDRDSMVNKRIDNVGILLGQLFRFGFKKFENENTKYFRNKNNSDDQPINVIPKIKHTVIEQNINSPLSSGTWSVSGKKGVAQVIHRYTYTQYSSVARRLVASQMSSNSKVTGMRFAHNSMYGFIDIPETPEHGHNVGTTKQLSNIASISVNAPAQPAIIKEFLEDRIYNLEDVPCTLFSTYTKIMINGEWIGVTDDPVTLTADLKQMRITGEIEKQVSIAHHYNKKEININTDAGRLLRPLLRVVNNKLVLTDKMLEEINYKHKTNPLDIHTWTDFLSKYPETVDIIDPEEQETLMIAMWTKDVEENYNRMNTIIKKPNFFGDPINRYNETVYRRYTHCELHPSTTAGNVLSNAIFPEHNDAPRNYFNFSQQKQALGIYCSNYRHRADIAYTLYHPQRPLVYNRLSKYSNTLSLPYSQNCTVAILMYGGYNQEDSLIMKKSAIERGLFLAESYKKESLSINKTTTTQDETFKKPEKIRTAGMKVANYEKLNEHGYIPEETPIENNDVIFGKTTPLSQIDENHPDIVERDTSLIYKAGVPGVIDKMNTKFKNSDGFLTYSCRIRQLRIPIGGDKFCCYTSDHDIMTEKGWMPINELTRDVKVATINHFMETDILKYEYPLDIQEFDYDGELYHVDSNQVNLVTTPNHRMYVGNRNRKNYQIKEAKDIYGKRVCFKKNVEWVNIDRNTPYIVNDEFVLPGVDDLPDLHLDMQSWLMFFGIYIAEGCMVRDWGISFATHKPRVKFVMTDICNTMGFEIRKHKDKVDDFDRNAWCFNDKRLSVYFGTLARRARDKYLPEWVWHLNAMECRILISGMCLGDGHTMANGTRRYDTSSTQLADDFQRLCFHAGWSCNKAVKYKGGHASIITSGRRAGETITSTTDAYRLTIITSQNRPIVNKNITKDGKNRHDSYITFDNEKLDKCIKNKVFCCTVPGDGIVYVRRRGVVSLSGNSRHGQKGTIGYILRDEDMPYTSQGIRPDIIINACCIPSRMTIGQLVEAVMNKYAAINKRSVLVDQFEHIDMDPVIRTLQKYKNDLDANKMSDLNKEELYKSTCEVLYNGYNGRKIDTPVFMNITTYLRLKHLVDDKIHARARGPMSALIRQPLEGRARHGGLRLGEMERDAFIGHGLALTLKGKYMDNSDGYKMWVCSHCGLIARKKINKNVYVCDACESLKPSDKPMEKPYIHQVSIPYSCKIFFQELMAVNILPRIRMKDTGYTRSI